MVSIADMDAKAEFQGAATGNIFNYGNQYGLCVTGDHNINYQIILTERAQLEELKQAIAKGVRKVEQVREAAPLPTLVLSITTVSSATTPQWRIAWHVPRPDNPVAPQAAVIPNPRTPDFLRRLDQFYQMASTALLEAEKRAALNALAIDLGDVLTAIIPQTERQRLANLGRAEGPPPFLIIESEEDAILSLPWELLRLANEWSVRDGRLDVARCVPNRHAACLSPPTGPATVYVNVCAPESDRAPGLSYEMESYRISRALAAHESAQEHVRVNEMGELDDLLNVVCGNEPPVVVHFSGHGGKGRLLFENEFGQGLDVPIHDLITRIRQKGVRRWPRLFYLACCYGHTPTGDNRDAGVTSTAARLHQEGIPQIMAHFGPVYGAQATDAEAVFYAALAEGRRTREAVRVARAALAKAFHPPPREPQRYTEAAADADSLTPFAWALLLLYHAGEDYPLGLPVKDRPPDVTELIKAPVERVPAPAFAGSRSKVLRHGFIGRRPELHHLRRRMRDGRHVHVVQGLGGLGKSTFCHESLKVYARLGWQSVSLWCADMEDAKDPATALLSQFTQACQPLNVPAWSEIACALERKVFAPSARLDWLLRALLAVPEGKPVVVHLDNVESLFVRLDREDYRPDAVSQWRDAECQRCWRVLAETARRSAGRLALLASCRYQHEDFRPTELFPMPPMPRDTVLRMFPWFEALRRLSWWTRDALLEHLEGHPRAVEFLDGLVCGLQEQWLREQGELQLPPVLSQQQAEAEEWPRFIEPILAECQRKLREDLLFAALWSRVLRESEQRLLLRLTVLRQPAHLELVHALADTATARPDTDRLRRSSLLGEICVCEQEQEFLRFQVHPMVAALACEVAGTKAEEQRHEGAKSAIPFFLCRDDLTNAFKIAFPLAMAAAEAGDFTKSADLLRPFGQPGVVEKFCQESMSATLGLAPSRYLTAIPWTKRQLWAIACGSRWRQLAIMRKRAVSWISTSIMRSIGFGAFACWPGSAETSMT